MSEAIDFQDLTPDAVIDAVEEATGTPLTGFASPLPSYINRVYELETQDRDRLIAKFYRPGRWSLGALEDEHRFVLQCHEAEIPVIAPDPFKDGETLAQVDGIYFAVYPKRGGRELELNDEEGWVRLGQVLGRLHAVGAQEEAESRLRLHPLAATDSEVKLLLDGGFVTDRFVAPFRDVTSRIIDTIADWFEDVEIIRLHGDCHRANLFERPDEGIHVIDFDDMVNGPPVQDMWLLLPEHASDCQREIDLLLNGYEQFRDFEYDSLRLIEPLRAMRIIYFLSWCTKQLNDYRFQHNFPDWGTDSFWQREVNDLERQFSIIEHEDRRHSGNSAAAYVGRILTDH